jgi:hypothetical protein
MAEPSAHQATSPADGPEAEERAALAAETRLGGSERARRANLALLALSRAARSFLLYDPANDAIRRFIEDLRTKMAQALAGGDSLRFEVRPFELALDGEVVYVEHDREHSLAFRLYRDGVRRLTISGASDWDELLRLLEVLSIRYTGVRQNEDDIVTLLWKAGFKHIEIEAVEGFAPDEEDGGGGRHHAQAAVPPDWDLPPRRLVAPAEPLWREVPEAQREAVSSAEASHLLAANAAQAAATLLDRACNPSDPMTLADVEPFVKEVRDFLLSEGQLEPLTTLVRLMQLHVRSDPERLSALIAGFGDRRALGQILHSTPKGETKPPPELIRLLDLMPEGRLSRLLDVLAAERGEASRRVCRQLIEHYAQEAPEEIVSRLRKAEPAVVCDLLRALAGALPERAGEVAVELATHPDMAIASEALRRLEKAPPGPRVARALVRMLASPHDELRLKVLDLIAERYGAAVFDSLVRSTEARAPAGFAETEAEKLGQTLARLAPPAALPVLQGWLRPKGLVGRLVESRERHGLAQVAVAGLGCLRAEEAERTLRDFSARAGAELRRQCLAALARRHHPDKLYG